MTIAILSRCAWSGDCRVTPTKFYEHRASRPTHQLLTVPSDAGSMLVHAHNGRIDHLHGRLMVGGQCIHDPVPDASPAPRGTPRRRDAPD